MSIASSDTFLNICVFLFNFWLIHLIAFYKNTNPFYTRNWRKNQLVIVADRLRSIP